VRKQQLDDLEQRVVGRILARHADTIGAEPWLRTEDRIVTFGDAWETVNRMANGLADLGVQRGDIVAFHMEPSIDVVLAGIACSRVGAMFTPMSTDYQGEFLGENITASTARVVVVDAALAKHTLALQKPPALEHVVVNGELPAGAEGGEGLALHTLDALAQSSRTPLPFTERFNDRLMAWWSSGTTGKPKGVMHTHSSLMRSADFWIADRPDLSDDDVFYSCFPMYLGGAWTTAVWPSLVAGVRAAIDPRFSVTNYWDQTRRYGATQIATLGAMHMYLLEAPERPDDRDNPVRVAVPNPMPWNVVPIFKERFGIEKVFQMYGQSEVATRILFADDDGTPWRANALGRPVWWLDVKLVDEHDREVAVGEVGEIVVRPKEPSLIYDGYLNMPEFTLATWRNLWHHTGDLARVEEDGQWFFADRKKDYIRHKGRNISMTEVESVVSRHPAVVEAAAYGIEAEIESEAELALALVLRDDTTCEDIARFINANAPYYFVPRYIELMSEIPHNAQFKINKLALRERPVTAATWDRDAQGFEVMR
jgi:crotonobetaine/carnitine-CoA ligase